MSHARTAPAFAVIVAAVFLGCGGGSVDQPVPAEQVVEAFQDADLEAQDAAPIPPNEFGIAPMLTDDTSRFLIPDLGEDAGGRVFSFDNLDDLQETREVYDEVGEGSGLLFSWTFANEEAGVLVQINGDLPEGDARKYEQVVNGL